MGTALASLPERAMHEAPTIDQHAVIGDGRSTALVSAAGSVDWLCWPGFGPTSIFGARLDPKRGGRFQIAPPGPYRATRHYCEGSAVLVTRFHTSGGIARVVDLMAVDDGEDAFLRPEHELLRVVECEAGEVELEVVYDPRPDNAEREVRVEAKGRLGYRFHHARRLFTLAADVPLTPGRGGPLGARFRVRAGERRIFSLSCDDGPAALPPTGARALERVAQTLRHWRDWIAQSTYQGPYREEVVRSLLTLKLLAFAPAGAVVTAPTLLDPDTVGVVHDADERYRSTASAALVVRAFLGLGYAAEAEAYLRSLLHGSGLSGATLASTYDAWGRAPVDERRWPQRWPAKAGDARGESRAAEELRLAAYGDAIDAAWQLHEEVGELDRPTQCILRDLGAYVCRSWQHSDPGPWQRDRDPAARGQHHTHSAVLCWVALDRLIRMRQRGALRVSMPIERFALARCTIREAVERRGWSPRRRSYTQTFDGDTVDASLLQLSWFRYHPPDHPRLRQTFRRIERRLDAGEGLLYRREQDLGTGRGAVGLCSFGGVEHLADGGGHLEEARASVEALLSRGDDLGLYGEEIDPETGAALGGFPQSSSHVALLSAAVALEERARREQRRAQHARAEAEAEAGRARESREPRAHDEHDERREPPPMRGLTAAPASKGVRS